MFSIFSVLIQIIGEILACTTVCKYFLPQSTYSVPRTLLSYVLLNLINMGIRYSSLEQFYRWRKWDMSSILLSFTFQSSKVFMEFGNLCFHLVCLWTSFLLSQFSIWTFLSSELSQVGKLSICFVLDNVVEMERCEKE